MPSAKPVYTFEDFLQHVNPNDLGFMTDLHEALLSRGCALKLQPATNGFVATYDHKKSKKALVNFVFRKSGLVARVYGNSVNGYETFLGGLPGDMRKVMTKAPNCRRMLNPNDCNSRCPMGYDYTLDDIQLRKCRYSAFMFAVNEESKPFINDFIMQEINMREAV